jgi:hypothetical protein
LLSGWVENGVGLLNVKGIAVARILLDETEIDVSEDVEDILNRIVNSRDGLRRGGGAVNATILELPGRVASGISPSSRLHGAGATRRCESA